jgi:hypothetical protein
MIQTQNVCPNPDPGEETPVADSPAFVSRCMSEISKYAAELDWRLGKSLLTHSDTWGLVLRIDFRTKAGYEDSNFMNRTVCWGSADGTLVGTATFFGEKFEPL